MAWHIIFVNFSHVRAVSAITPSDIPLGTLLRFLKPLKHLFHSFAAPEKHIYKALHHLLDQPQNQ